MSPWLLETKSETLEERQRGLPLQEQSLDLGSNPDLVIDSLNECGVILSGFFSRRGNLPRRDVVRTNKIKIVKCFVYLPFYFKGYLGSKIIKRNLNKERQGLSSFK